MPQHLRVMGIDLAPRVGHVAGREETGQVVRRTYTSGRVPVGCGRIPQAHPLTVTRPKSIEERTIMASQGPSEPW